MADYEHWPTVKMASHWPFPLVLFFSPPSSSLHLGQLAAAVGPASYEFESY